MFKIFLFALLSFNLQAKEVSVLFLGNSLTFMPGVGDEEDPALPKLIKSIGESIDPAFKMSYAFNTPGGYSFKMHLNDPKSMQLLKGHYDLVVLQGNSIEALDMPPWWEEFMKFPGEKEFAITLPQGLDLAFKAAPRVALYVNWGWNPKHKLVQDDARGLLFPEGHPKAGQKWCGKDKYEWQSMLDASFTKHSQGYPVEFARVGAAWLRLQDMNLVGQDELYRPSQYWIVADWLHASPLGAYVTALIFAKDVFHLDISKNTFTPEDVPENRAREIAQALAAF